MRTVLIFATTVVAAGGLSFGLHWVGWLSHDAMVFGILVGFVVAVLGAIHDRRLS